MRDKEEVYTFNLLKLVLCQRMIFWFDLCNRVMCCGFVAGILFSLIIEYEND